MSIVDIVIDLHFTQRRTTAAPKAAAGGNGMNITQRDPISDRLCHEAVHDPDRTDAVGRGTPMANCCGATGTGRPPQ